MNLKSIIRPFEVLPGKQRSVLIISWVIFMVAFWFISTSGQKHLFPSPDQVWEGMQALYSEGLVVHVLSSLGLCLQATLIAVVFSLTITYLSPMPLMKPVATLLSRMRYLPLTGITFYLALILNTAREMQISILVIFMSLYFITSLLGMLKNIPQEELDHARSLKANRWEVLWEVVIKGRLDHVIDVLRQNLAIVWMMLVTVESILVASGGLGVLIKNSDKFMNHGRIVALQIVILLVGLGIDFLLNKLRKSFFRFSKF